MLIDSHCHLTYPELSTQLDAVVQRAVRAGVSRIITIATSIDDARAGVEVLRRHPNVCMAAGIHPHEAGKCTPDDLAALAALHRDGFGPLGQHAPVSSAITTKTGPPNVPVRNESAAAVPANRLVAVGETGLDFHYDFAPRGRQEDVFRAQLALASDVDRPVVIHARESEDRVCDILAEYPRLAGRVVFHCFSGDGRIARRALDMGFFLSFTGVATFANADNVREAARLVPADRFMVETDAPYLSPVPVRKVRPCEPAFVAHTARFLAQLRGEPFETLAVQTSANAVRFFSLPEVTT